jgi:acetylornithine deacetylase
VEPGRTNVLTTWGEPKVVLSSHIDTVPPYVPFRWDGETFWGRGTCDAKGQWIAQLLAIKTLRESHPEVGFAWIGLVGEETGSEGARHAKSRWTHLAETCSLVLNGEPTEGLLATGQRGTARYRLSYEGIATHSGTPELGRNAIRGLMGWIEALDAHDLGSDPKLGKEIWNLGVIHGGTATNVLPGEAYAEIMLRFVAGSKFEALLDETKPEFGKWECLSSTPYCYFASIPGFETTIVPYGSDAPHLVPLSKDGRVLLVGPGTIKVAHRADEHLSLKDLLEGANLIRRIVLQEIS